MKNLLGAALLGIMIAFSSCEKDRITGGGSITTEDRTANNFTRISTGGSANVSVSKGADFKVQVKGYTNLLPYYETKVVNGTLQLGYKGSVNVRRDNIEVMVTMPALNGLSINGSGEIVSTGDFTNNFTGNTDFDVNISGSGTIALKKGYAENFKSTINGSGNIEAFDFMAEKANVKISGSGNTRITAVDDLNVKITGSGRVYYKGSPNTTINISGSGSVTRQQ